MKVVVGSQNPAKIEAVQQGFNRIWPDEQLIVYGLNAPSGVSDQPMSDEESIQGARNRAQVAMEREKVDYSVGLEGGLQQVGELWFDCGWIVVRDSKGNEGVGSTAKIITPPKMIKGIQQGKELGDVVDELFGTTNAKQAEGHFGLMTNNAITRINGYADGVVMALSRFLHPWLF